MFLPRVGTNTIFAEHRDGISSRCASGDGLTARVFAATWLLGGAGVILEASRITAHRKQANGNEEPGCSSSLLTAWFAR